MSNSVFLIALAILIPALVAVMVTVGGMIADEFREGHRTLALTMIAAVAVMVAAVLPWYLL